MRRDFGKLLSDIGKSGEQKSKGFRKKKREKATSVRPENWDNAETRAGMRYRGRGGHKDDGHGFKLLYRFLDSCAGQKWDDIYSAICKNINRGIPTNNDIFWYIRHAVAFPGTRDSHVYSYYVDDNGIFHIRFHRDKFVWKRESPPNPADYVGRSGNVIFFFDSKRAVWFRVELTREMEEYSEWFFPPDFLDKIKNNEPHGAKIVTKKRVPLSHDRILRKFPYLSYKYRDSGEWLTNLRSMSYEEIVEMKSKWK